MTYTANRQEGILVAQVGSSLCLVMYVCCWLSADFAERMKHHILFPYNRILLELTPLLVGDFVERLISF